jgi:predicted site-specific integrase-resolvase
MGKLMRGGCVVEPINYLDGKAQGLTDEEVAEHYCVHINTVRRNLYRLYKELGANNVANAVAIAKDRNLIPRRYQCDEAA